MKRFLRDNGLSLILALLFILCLLGHSLTGHREHNQDRAEHREAPISYAAYLKSGHFLESVFENWESEFLQMAFYVILTVFLYQRGSSESKNPNRKEEVEEDPRKHQRDPDAPSPVRKGGVALKLYQHSLSSAFLGLFLFSFVLHASSGLAFHNLELRDHGQPAMTIGSYLGSSRFWFESFQNWQSEFLAVGSIVVLSIFLREWGSPESKPVAAPHHETGKG